VGSGCFKDWRLARAQYTASRIAGAQFNGFETGGHT
jgi:hypothetical protein